MLTFPDDMHITLSLGTHQDASVDIWMCKVDKSTTAVVSAKSIWDDDKTRGPQLVGGLGLATIGA